MGRNVHSVWVIANGEFYSSCDPRRALSNVDS